MAALYSRDLPAVSAAAAFAATCRGVETLVQGTSGLPLNARWLAGWVSVSEQTRWGALGASSCTASSSSCMILPPPVKQTAMSLGLPTTSFSIEIKLVAGSSGKVQRSVRASFATLLKLLIENPSPSELADASAKLSATVSARTPVQMLHELSLPSSGSYTIWANHTPPAASTFEQLVASLVAIAHPLEAERPSNTLGRFAALAGVGMAQAFGAMDCVSPISAFTQFRRATQGSSQRSAANNLTPGGCSHAPPTPPPSPPQEQLECETLVEAEVESSEEELEFETLVEAEVESSEEDTPAGAEPLHHPESVVASHLAVSESGIGPADTPAPQAQHHPWDRVDWEEVAEGGEEGGGEESGEGERGGGAQREVGTAEGGGADEPAGETVGAEGEAALLPFGVSGCQVQSRPCAYPRCADCNGYKPSTRLPHRIICDVCGWQTPIICFHGHHCRCAISNRLRNPTSYFRNARGIGY